MGMERDDPERETVWLAEGLKPAPRMACAGMLCRMR
jgi:hypothetical protein